MESRTLDIAAFIAAIVIVASIAFFAGYFPGSGEDNAQGGTGPQEKSPAGGTSGTFTQTFSPTTTPAAVQTSGRASTAALPSYLTKEDRNLIISGQVSEGMDYYLPATRNYAASYIPEEHSGVYSIEQAADAWDGSVADWNYLAGSGGLLDISPASRSINTGLSGDGADYAVFLASMIKAVGGEARIKSAKSSDGGEHIYTELYLGNSEDFATPVINPEKLNQSKANYSAIYAMDPSGLSIYKYRYGRLCNGDTCYDFVNPLFDILNEPEKYGEVCYNYPKLIEYLLLFPDTNEVEFQALYLQVRYGDYDYLNNEVRDIRQIEYSYDLEENGDKTYWLGMELFGDYPGDLMSRDIGSATVYYSDGSYKTVKINKDVAPVIN